jgi:hypothetical protein
MERINNECYVSLEVAKLLKKAGFDWECRKIYYCYREDDDTWELEDNYKIHKHILELDYCLLAPTLDVAQRWLREVKGYSIYPTRGGYKIYVLDINDSAGFSRTYELNSNLTYEESQESGIKKIIEIILKKGE